MTATLLPNAKQQFIDSNGKPLAGGSVYFYIPNTSTLKNTYQDAAQTILNTNPVILDASGQAIIWGNGVYRQVVYDQFGNLIWDQITEDLTGGLLGDFTDATFSAGVDFTPGTTKQLTLPANFGGVPNIFVFFDGVFQGDDQIQSLVGTTLTFFSPIPVGVQKVYVKGGTTVAIGTPGAGTVTFASLAPGSSPYNRAKTWADPMDFPGCDPTGVSDSTSAILAALGSNPDVRFGIAGTYLCGQITLPATMKNLEAANGVIIKPAISVPTASAVNWWSATGLVSARIHGFTFLAPSVTYPMLTCISSATPNGSQIFDNTFNGSGFVAISQANGINCKIYRNQCLDWKETGIVISGSSLSVVDTGTESFSNYCLGNGPSSVAHGITHQFAVDFDCHDNKCQAAGTFGIAALSCSAGRIHDNLTYNTTHEGINTEDSSIIEIRNNVCRWDNGGSNPGTDFGISVFGNAANCAFIDVIDNKIINSASSGICLTGSASFGVQNSLVQGNSVINCNQKQAAVAGGTDNLAAILLSATLTQANAVKHNQVFDSLGVLTYGIAEHNFGLGAPSSNEITNNRLFSQVRFITAPIQRTNTFTTLALNTPDLAGLQAYVPTITPSAGAISAYTAAGGYVQIGRTIFWYATISVSNNGSGAGQLLVSIPFLGVTSASLGAGMCSGNNVSVGKALTGTIPSGASAAIVTNYDGNYPVASGQTINLFGIELLA